MGSDIVAEEPPFLEFNDNTIRSAKKHIIIKGGDVVPYASPSTSDHPTTRRIQTYVCRLQYSDTGGCTTFNVPQCMDGEVVAVEPRTCSKTYEISTWPEPQITAVVNGQINPYKQY